MRRLIDRGVKGEPVLTNEDRAILEFLREAQNKGEQVACTAGLDGGQLQAQGSGQRGPQYTRAQIQRFQETNYIQRRSAYIAITFLGEVALSRYPPLPQTDHNTAPSR